MFGKRIQFWEGYQMEFQDTQWLGSVFNVRGSNQHFGTIMSGLGNVEVL